MPRDGLQQYSPPPGTQGIPNYTVESARYNTFVADITQDLNLPRPIVAGGTGASSADGALDNLSAEKFKQVVTNWDSNPWRAGSFYAATTASGSAPVAGHAFAGIAYYANATDLVTEATDLTDTANPDQYIRAMAAGVWGPWIRTNSTTSSANLGEYTFDNQVTFPPGVGTVRFNNATQSLTTELFISHLNPTGNDNTAALTSYLKKSVDIVVQDKDEGAKYKIFTATADAVLSGGDFRILVALKSAGVDIVSAQRVLLAASGEAQRVQQRQLYYAAPFDALACNGMQINGSMEVSQETGFTGITNAAGYVCDGWKLAFNGGMGFTALTDNGGGTLFYTPYRLRVTISVAAPTLAAGNYLYLTQPIEGWRCLRLQWGTANAQPITIGFWTAHTRTGPYSVVVQNTGSGRSYATTYTQNAAAIAQYNVVTIPGDTAGTWNIDNTIGMAVIFTMGCGTTYTAPTANVWASGNYIAAPGQVNGVAATSDVFRITGVVVLPGIEAPSAARSPLIMRPFDQELAACRRYWESRGGRTLAFTGNIVSGNVYASTTTFTASKRIIPTVVVNFAAQSGHFSAGAPTYSVTTDGFEIEVTATATIAFAYYMMTFTADARL